MKIGSLTVGPVQENTYVAINEQTNEAIVIDPGDEPNQITAALDASGAKVSAILITHCHFDHVGAVAPVARHTGAEVWVPQLERPALEDIMNFVPWKEFGPYENYDAEHDVSGGEKLNLAGFEIDVIFTPGHSPGHVTYSFASEAVIFSGDVLFQGSVGRTDLPGGSAEVLQESIAQLIAQLPPETQVCPGHGGPTTLAAERESNPFLAALR
ncbi:MAG: MBL fold metallo-hydrolase [Thermoleophilaceae bacterium]|nr:MBL fold metallo-hydrolase [Thermoleophilaceae bacterium]